jgi:hypothetical protein
LDYGTSLKLNDGVVAVKHLLRMLHLHLCLDHQSRGGAYTQSIIMQLLIVLHQKAHNLPQWRILKTSLSTFNEEAGEITFSQLARCVVGDTQQRKLDHINQIYKLLHIYGELEEEHLADTHPNKKAESSRRKIPKDCETVDAVAQFMKTKFREMKQKKFLMYDGKESSYKSRLSATRNMIAYKTKVPFWVADPVAFLRFNITKSCTKFFDTDWAGEYATIWPGCKIPPEHHAIVPEGLPADFNEEHSGDSGPDVPEPDEVYVQPPKEVRGKKKKRKSQKVWSSGEEDSASDHVSTDDPDEEPDDSKHDTIPGAPALAPKPIGPTTCAINASNVMTMARGERAGRGVLRNNSSFPMLSHVPSGYYGRAPNRKKK